uniref:Uncharacterized protein n=1 Tax=Gossypium raimondii TaxID=29730 RepID=A0A0D2QHY2_GOSRA|nr:hypothetical protein B456_001G164900 [Gossypium raimondii]
MSWIELSLQPFSIRSSGSLKGCIPKSNLSAPVADFFLAFSSPAFACFRARKSAKVFTSNCASPDSFSLSLESSPLPKHRFQPLVVRLIQLKNKGQLASSSQPVGVLFLHPANLSAFERAPNCSSL